MPSDLSEQDRETLADALGAMPEAFNRYDATDEAETWIEARVDAIADALAPVVAGIAEEAWNRGYRSGFSNAMRRMSDEPDAPTSPNPYRRGAVITESTRVREDREAGSAYKGDATVPVEAFDLTHPDHDEWVKRTGRCLAGDECYHNAAIVEHRGNGQQT